MKACVDRTSRGSASSDVIKGNSNIPTKSRDFRSPHRAAAHRRREFVIAPLPQVRDLEILPGGTLLPGRIVGSRGDLIPRTDFLAHVAAVHARSDGGCELVRDRTALLDGQIRDTPGRIEHTRLR